MADSTITLTSSSYQGRQNRVVFEQYKDVANNRSRIHWTFYSEGGSSTYYTTGPVTIMIDGQQAYYCSQTSYSTHQFPASKGEVSGDVYVDHDSNGNKSITVSLETAIYVSATSTYSSGWTLSSIPRYATISASVASRSFNSVRINWSTDVNVDQFQYKLGSGNWIDVETNIDKRSGSFTIPNLTPNTSYKISFDAKRKDSQQWSTWGDKGTSVNTTTYDIGKISSVQGFNHGDNAIVVTTNPSESPLDLTMEIDDTEIFNKTVQTGNNAINFTDEELDSIYRKYGSSNQLTATFILRTANNSNYTDTKTATITLTGNQKTAHVSQGRAKVFIGVNGSVKRAVVWVGNNGRKRCI
jgi:hypothetical protein